MSTAAKTLAPGVLPPAQDYEFLRAEGLRRIQQLAGARWTDHNTHDPGITILEQLCYAITDLAYRADHPVADLLARPDGTAPYAALFSPRQILSTQPVSSDDLRQVLLDVEGVKNAWVEALGVPEPGMLRQSNNIRLAASGSDPKILKQARFLKGLLQVNIEPDIPYELVSPADKTAYVHTLRKRISDRLLEVRNAGEDLHTIHILEPEYLIVEADMEIESGVDPTQLLTAVYECLDNFISPRTRFYSLREMLDKGRSMEEIMEGPQLLHGYIDPEESGQTEKRAHLRGSDLINTLMDIPGVVVVRKMNMKVVDAQLNEITSDAWSIALQADRYPVLLTPGENQPLKKSTIGMFRGPYQARPVLRDFEQNWIDIQSRKRPLALPEHDMDSMPAPGRYRHVADYYSVQQQMPNLYGVGDAGLSEQAGPERHARAKQLKAYLNFFDQILANYFAQLDNVRDLFSFDQDAPHTYFSQVPESIPHLQEMLVHGVDNFKKTLPDLTENSAAGGANSSLNSRRQRLLDHLLARFGETFTEYSLVLYGATDGNPHNRLIADKQAFLQQYPALSAGRGTGFNYQQAGTGGLEARIAHLIGIHPFDSGAWYPAAAEGFYLIEHLLLRPLPEDRDQNGAGQAADFLFVPRAQSTQSSDPFSHQLSFVFPNWIGRLAEPDFRELLVQTIRAESPAHLSIYIHWLDQASMQQFHEAYMSWRSQMKDYAAGRLDVSNAPNQLLPLREARNILIDQLAVTGENALGFAYPLADLPVQAAGGRDKIFEKETAKIEVGYSETGVVYQLWDKTTRQASGKAVNGTGKAKPIVLTSAALESPLNNLGEVNIVFEIRAVKNLPGQAKSLSQTLRQEVTIGVRLLKWDLAVEIAAGKQEIEFQGDSLLRIKEPQEGVHYTLHLAPLRDIDYTYFLQADKSLGYRVEEAYVRNMDAQFNWTRTTISGVGAKNDLEIPIPADALPQDMAIKVEAQFGGQGPAEFLDARVFVFVGPDPAVVAKENPNQKGQEIIIEAPEAGVLYSLMQGDNIVAAAAYTPDKKIANDTDTAATGFRSAVDLAVDAVTAPPVVLPIPAITQTTTFSIQAQKLNNRIRADLTKKVKITK